MYDKEVILKTKVKKLREQFKNELLYNPCYGEDQTIERATEYAKMVPSIVDVPNMITELEVLLEKYPDFWVESKPNLLRVQGKSTNRHSRLWLQYTEKKDKVIVAAVAEKEQFYCTQMEFIDNLAENFGFQLAGLIQDDDKMKEFYLKYLEWLEPYYRQVEEVRSKFGLTLAFLMGKLVESYPKEPATILPRQFNVPYLVHRIRQILEVYHLPNMDVPADWNLMGFKIYSNTIRYSCHIDYRTFNGLFIIYEDTEDEALPMIKVINERQTIMLIKELLSAMNQLQMPYCKLFAKELGAVLSEILNLEKGKEIVLALEELLKNYE